MTQFDITIPQIESDIRRNRWLKHHQKSVDRVRALVEALGNVRDWQLDLLEEVADQINERRECPLTALRLHQNSILDNPEEYQFFDKV
jgi:hypothetical protein